MCRVKFIVLFLCLVLGCMALVAVTMVANAESPQSVITDNADLIIADLLPVIQDKQVLYHVSNGQFYQGLISHSMVPTDGISLTLDMAYGHPTDQLSTWVDFFGPELPTELPFAMSIETHKTNNNSGFTCYFELIEGGILYRKAIGYGPASHSYDWVALP